MVNQDFKEKDDRWTLTRPIALSLIVLLTPVCVSLSLGGADWEIAAGARVTWYDQAVAWPMLGASGLLLVFRPRPTRTSAVLVFAGLIGCVVATLILWTGGGGLSFLSLRHPEMPAWIGLGSILLGTLMGRPLVAIARVSWSQALLALALGLLLQIALMRFDGARIASQIPTSSEPAAGPNVVWIVVDTLRADAIGIYQEIAEEPFEGRTTHNIASPIERPRTPILDRLARRGVVFEHVLSAAPWTLPSMMSAFTSRWPSTLDPEGRGRVRGANELIGLDPGIPTWVGVFRKAGYHTAGLQKNPFLGDDSGFETPFDYYRVVGGDRAELKSGAQLVRATLRWADELVRARAGQEVAKPVSPFLLYVHFMEPHIDYRPPPSWLSKRAREYKGRIDGRAVNFHRLQDAARPIADEDVDQLRRLYASEVAYVDAQIGALVEGLRARGLVDDATLLVVTSDHGEQFGEHGSWEHGDLHVENVHVPLILAGRGLGVGRVKTTISAIDLGPTLLDLVGLERLDGAQGRSRLPLVDGGQAVDESPRLPVWTEYGARTRVVIEPWVLIERDGGAIALFDQRNDPYERVDVSKKHPKLVAHLKRRLRSHFDDPGDTVTAPERNPDRETSEALRDLGYIW